MLSPLVRPLVALVTQASLDEEAQDQHNHCDQRTEEADLANVRPQLVQLLLQRRLLDLLVQLVNQLAEAAA